MYSNHDHTDFSTDTTAGQQNLDAGTEIYAVQTQLNYSRTSYVAVQNAGYQHRDCINRSSQRRLSASILQKSQFKANFHYSLTVINAVHLWL